MGVPIYYKEEYFYKFSNRAFSNLLEYYCKAIEKSTAEFPEVFYQFIEENDQNYFGIGCVNPDLAHYFKTKENFMLFSNLIRKGLYIFFSEYDPSDECQNYMWEFYYKLLEVIEKDF